MACKRCKVRSSLIEIIFYLHNSILLPLVIMYLGTLSCYYWLLHSAATTQRPSHHNAPDNSTTNTTLAASSITTTTWKREAVVIPNIVTCVILLANVVVGYVSVVKHNLAGVIVYMVLCAVSAFPTMALLFVLKDGVDDPSEKPQAPLAERIVNPIGCALFASIFICFYNGFAMQYALRNQWRREAEVKARRSRDLRNWRGVADKPESPSSGKKEELNPEEEGDQLLNSARPSDDGDEIRPRLEVDGSVDRADHLYPPGHKAQTQSRESSFSLTT